MAETIFSKIINGEIPAHVIYEDDKVIAFLDIYPISEGHTLVVPKNAAPTVWELPKDDYEALMYSVKQLAISLKEALNKDFVGMQVVGVDIPHAHVHLIPFDSIEEYHHHPDANQKPDHEALAALAARIQKQV